MVFPFVQEVHMDSRTMTAESLSAFEQYLKTEERSDATIEKTLSECHSGSL